MPPEANRISRLSKDPTLVITHSLGYCGISLLTFPPLIISLLLCLLLRNPVSYWLNISPSVASLFGLLVNVGADSLSVFLVLLFSAYRILMVSRDFCVVLPNRQLFVSHSSTNKQIAIPFANILRVYYTGGKLQRAIGLGRLHVSFIVNGRIRNLELRGVESPVEMSLLIRSYIFSACSPQNRSWTKAPSELSSVTNSAVS